MPNEHMVVEQAYSRGQTRYAPGRVIEVPVEVARAMEEATPPYGRPATEDEVRQGWGEVARAPEINATPAALELAAERGLDLAPYSGQGSGSDGRITKADVDEWSSPAAE